jgi:hypothetical protein
MMAAANARAVNQSAVIGHRRPLASPKSADSFGAVSAASPTANYNAGPVAWRSVASLLVVQPLFVALSRLP